MKIASYCRQNIILYPLANFLFSVMYCFLITLSVALEITGND